MTHHLTISRDEAARSVEAVNECLEEGFPLEARGPGATAKSEAARRLGLTGSSLRHRLETAKREYDLAPDPSRYVPRPPTPKPPPFRIDALPNGPELSAPELIRHLAAQHRRKKVRDEAAKLRHVHVLIDGPIAVGMFGDPHVDDPGCAWGDLERDVGLCRDTEGLLAVNVGDNSNNWVGRLMRLYADQEVTSKQALQLIEWVMTQLPWLEWEPGNHDEWNTEKGDVTAFMHRLLKRPGIFGDDSGNRMEVHLPGGASFKMHVRHDFPGGSQFNPAHALVRQTLFDFRDHILVCGHRHHSGYIPIWHNDPPRLCHGFRCGTYKDFDKHARTKGFKDENWARSMGAVIDPAFAHDPVRFIARCYSIEETAEYLTWRRQKWELGYSHSA